MGTEAFGWIFSFWEALADIFCAAWMLSLILWSSPATFLGCCKLALGDEAPAGDDVPCDVTNDVIDGVDVRFADFMGATAVAVDTTVPEVGEGDEEDSEEEEDEDEDDWDEEDAEDDCDV